MQVKVLIGLAPGLPEAVPELRKDYPQVKFESILEVDDLEAAIADADVYVGLLNRNLFLAAKRLKWIQAPSAGVEAFLAIPELVESDVRLTNARGVSSACVAESAMAMILAFTRGIKEAVLNQQKRAWSFFEIRSHMVELTGSTMGIIGLGAIGRALAKRAKAFDLRILAVDINPIQKPDEVDALWGIERLEDLLRQSDYVVITVPYTPQTRNMIDEEQLALMKPSAMLIVVSRGGIVNEKALARALREKRLAAAALDVFEAEPLPPDSELWDIPNLLITPHIAGATQYEAQRLLALFRENLDRFLEGRFPLINEVDKLRGY